MFRMLGLIAVATCLSSGAMAMPLANYDAADKPQVTLVSGGCGPYAHRNPWGHCRPGGQWGGGYYGYGGGYGSDRCPVGYHLGQRGRLCWPN